VREVGRLNISISLFIYLELSVMGWERRYRGITFLSWVQGKLRWTHTTT
jgi:hypothetical protein